MVVHQLNQRIQQKFLSEYDETPFIIRKKAYVLMWLLLIIIPVIIGFIFINIVRNDPYELIPMLIIDVVFMVMCFGAFFLLKSGRFNTAVTLIVSLNTSLAVAGYIAKYPSVVQTGFNSFVIFMLANIVFIAIFGSRRALLMISVLFFGFNVAEFFLIRNIIAPELYGYLLSGMLNTVIGLIIIGGFCYFNRLITDEALIITQNELDKNMELNDKLAQKVEQTTEALEDTVKQVKTLSGLLPICASCKKIRDDTGYWQQIEWYIREHSDAEFSHGICPDCKVKLYPEIFCK